MKKTLLFLSSVTLLSFFFAHVEGATNNEVRFLTLSNGNYNEFYNNDSIVQIGTALLNTYTNKIVGFVADDTTELVNSSDNSSRWHSIDPLAQKYYQISPYVYVDDNPLIYIDPNGKEKWKFGLSFKTTTGIFGIKSNFLGSNVVSASYGKGASSQEIKLYISYDTKTGKLDIGATHTQSSIKEQSSAKIGPIGGSESKEKKTEIDINSSKGITKTEDKTYEKTEEGSIGKVTTQDNGKETTNKVEFGPSADVNAGILGVGFGINIEKTSDNNTTQNNSSSNSNNSTNNLSNNKKDDKK